MADAKAFGLALPEPDAPEDFEIWPDNWPAVEMFLRCQTQWRTTSAGVCGFDYVALEWLFRLYEVEEPATVLENCLLYTSPSPRDVEESRMPSSA